MVPTSKRRSDHESAAVSPGRLAMPVLACALAIGCAGPAIRSQSPEIEALASLENDTKLVGDYAAPWGLNPQRIERAALVTGLAGTGSDPPPGAQRQALMADMQSRGVVEPNRLLASPTTSLVWVHGYLPPGVRRGDRFDVHVEVPPDCETTSLADGWLMETRLSEMAVLGSRIRDGHVLGIAEGPLLVDPVSTGTLDPVSRLRGKVPGGGVARSRGRSDSSSEPNTARSRCRNGSETASTVGSTRRSAARNGASPRRRPTVSSSSRFPPSTPAT